MIKLYNKKNTTQIRDKYENARNKFQLKWIQLYRIQEIDGQNYQVTNGQIESFSNQWKDRIKTRTKLVHKNVIRSEGLKVKK